MTNPGLSAVFIYRIQSFLTDLKLIPLAKIAYRTNISKNGFDVAIGSKIGHSFRVSHPVGVVIGNKFKAGDNLTIMAQVVIGQKSFTSTEFGSENPEMGDNVKIGAGAIVLGGIVIGSNSTIAAGTFLTEDLLPNSFAFGNPVKIRIVD
jgi:serine O-acetyltransferase